MEVTRRKALPVLIRLKWIWAHRLEWNDLAALAEKGKKEDVWSDQTKTSTLSKGMEALIRKHFEGPTRHQKRCPWCRQIEK